MHPVSTAVFSTLSLLTPFDIDRPKQRVGNERDGAYIIVDAEPAVDILSFGISNDVGFEQDMADRGHRLFMFDHTIDAAPGDHERFFFHKLGICAPGEREEKLCTLEEHIESIADLSERLILKIDVEGYEWPVFAQLDPDVLARFDQILVEFHWMHRLADPAYRAMVTAALENLNSQFTMYHVHANNCCDIHIVSGFAVADVIEVSYVRTDLVQRKPSRTLYPTQINRGNHPNFFDLPLLFYPYLPTTVDTGEIDGMLARITADVE